MGLFSRIKDPVQGIANVVGAERWDGRASKGPCQVELGVQAPGVEPFSCTQTFSVWADRWPHPGDNLPVTFDRAKPERMEVDWDRLPRRMALAASTSAHVGSPLRGEQSSEEGR